jgi:N-acetylmuramoyl-L-alanine amidase
MARIVLSPSQQEANQYTGCGTGYTDSEQYWMEKIAKEAAAILRKAGHIVLVPETETYAGNVKAGNAFNALFYLAIHSNASGSHEARGTVTFYEAGDANGKRFATVVQANVAPVSEHGDFGVRESSSLGEVTRPTAKYHCLVEIAFHDNPLDAAEIRAEWQQYAKAIAQSILDMTGPAVVPHPGTARWVDRKKCSTLNMRKGPGTKYGIVRKLKADTELRLIYTQQATGWQHVERGPADNPSAVTAGWVNGYYLTADRPVNPL